MIQNRTTAARLRLATLALALALPIGVARAGPPQAPVADDPVAAHVALLADAVRRGDERQATEAARLLARYPGDGRVVKALAAALAAQPAIAAVAAAHLAALDRPEAVPPLLARARSRGVWKEPDRLRPLLQALGVTGAPAAAALFSRALTHPDLGCARAAIQGMAGLRAGRRAAVERMIAYLESLGASVRDMRATTARQRYEALSLDLVGSIAALTGQSFTADTTAMRRWWKQNRNRVKDRLEPEKPEKPEKARKPEGAMGGGTL